VGDFGLFTNLKMTLKWGKKKKDSRTLTSSKKIRRTTYVVFQ